MSYPHNGLVWGVTPDHTRDLLQDKLKAIGDALVGPTDNIPEEPAIALWMQIHIPCLVRHPPQPVTRFSSYYIQNWTLGFDSCVAALRIWIQIMGVGTSDPEDEKPSRLEPRRTLVIPAGTDFAFDDDLLRSIISSGGKLPDLPDEQVVVSVKRPNSNEDARENFSFYEMKFVFAQLSEDERQTLATSTEQAYSVLLPRLLWARYPYVGQAPWLDGPIGTATSPGESDSIGSPRSL